MAGACQERLRKDFLTLKGHGLTLVSAEGNLCGCLVLLRCALGMQMSLLSFSVTIDPRSSIRPQQCNIRQDSAENVRF